MNMWGAAGVMKKNSRSDETAIRLSTCTYLLMPPLSKVVLRIAQDLLGVVRSC
jgi:hypothetical protein